MYYRGIGRGLLSCNSMFEDFLDLGRPSIFSLGITPDFNESGLQYRDKTYVIEVRSYTSTMGGQVYSVSPLFLDGILSPGTWDILYEGGEDIPEFEEDVLKEFRKLNPKTSSADLVCHWCYNDFAKIPCDPYKFIEGVNPNYPVTEEKLSTNIVY